MRVRAWALLGLWAGLASVSASAVTVRLVVESASPGVLHDASAACESISGLFVCTEGVGARAVSGVLVADRRGSRLVGVRGVLQIEGGGKLVVERGTIDFGASEPDTLAAELVTRGRGVFRFLDRTYVGGDNALQNGWLHLNGTNVGSSGERFGLRLAAMLRTDPMILRRASAVPEPSFLLTIGALGFARLTRRARPA